MITLLLGSILENRTYQNVLVHENGSIFTRGASAKALAENLKKQNGEFKISLVKENYIYMQPDPMASKASKAEKQVVSFIKKGTPYALGYLLDELNKLIYPETEKTAVKKKVKKAPPKKAAVKKK